MSSSLSFPILMRAYRTQWRHNSSFWRLLVLVAAFAGFLVWRYDDAIWFYQGSQLTSPTRLSTPGEILWLDLAWVQTALVMLIAPSLTAGGIARERERGLLESLQMAPLSSARIVAEKWLSGLAPLILILLVLAPVNLVVMFLAGPSTHSLIALLAYQMLLAGAGAAIGIVCSAWGRRAHLALRSAYGLVILWLLGSAGAAFIVGDSGLSLPAVVPGAPAWMGTIGRTNPLLAAADLIMPNPFSDRLAQEIAVLTVLIALCGWSATRALRKPLGEAPFIEKGATKKTGRAAPLALPLVGGLRFENPVLGRELRSKFRLRQPSPGLILVEAILALAVAYFYVRLFWWALSDPMLREIIFWGVTFTGLTVTLIACAIMGANGFSREHEGGTWESLRLSMLHPRAIVAGKFGGIALSCALFSLPVWPLLLPCVDWSADLWDVSYGSSLRVVQLVAVVLVWSSSVLLMTMWGLWVGRRTRKSSSATGASLGGGLAWLLVLPIVIGLTYNGDALEWLMAAVNPFVALISTNDWRASIAAQLGAPFLAFSLIVGWMLWSALVNGVRADIGNDEREIGRLGAR